LIFSLDDPPQQLFCFYLDLLYVEFIFEEAFDIKFSSTTQLFGKNR